VTSHAFLFSNGSMQDLGTLGSTYAYAGSIGYGINTGGQITGVSQTTTAQLHAFVYSNGQMSDLNSLISGRDAALYTLQEGQALNDRGQIVVTAVVNAIGCTHALLLTPTKSDADTQ
jgi:probable HAF family extracellular repeat protein